MSTNDQILGKAKKLVEEWKFGSLKVGNMGYQFRYYQLINIAYLYLHGVDAKNQDILDTKNPHNFIPDFIDSVTKINEQTRIDFKELGFLVEGHSELAKYIAKAANRKNLTINNDWTEVMERVTDDANWYGSGFKKIYENGAKEQVHIHLSPWDIIWNLRDFKKSPKMEVMRKTVKEVITNKRYKQSARTALKGYYDEDQLDVPVEIFQYIDDDKLYVLDLLHGIVLMEAKRPVGLFFSKYDYEYRRGFNDAPGRGIFEKIMNVIIQNKVARERYNDVEAIVSKMLYAKVVDGKNDKVQNKQMQNLKTGLIIPVTSADNVPQPVNSGGQAQLQELELKIGNTSRLFDKLLQTPDVLGGDAKTLGAGASGVAINSLAEYASSVHKDVKKRYARVAEKEYRLAIMPYTLKAFNSEDNIKKYLDPTEWKIVQRNIVNYELAVKQAELLGSGVDPAEVDQMLSDYETQLRKDLKIKKIISEDVLEGLRNDVQGIQIVISGEKVSNTVSSQFYEGIKNDYMMNPAVFDDPRYINLTKQRAKTIGLDELTITEFINDLSQ